MIFYYFSSKENLYETVFRRVFAVTYPKMAGLFSSHPTPELFLEKVAKIYVNVFTENPEFVKMIALELLRTPETVTSMVKEFFVENAKSPSPTHIQQMIDEWYRQGLIAEEDSFQFMLNIVSLSLLSFIGKPFIEALFQQKIPEEDFAKKRLISVVNLLKRGMLS
jgi:AcrR family transcriptional regulator